MCNYLGILDSSVYPEQTPDPAHVQLIAVCTFVLNGPVFECAGTAICDDSGTGIDACIGGVPWRGMRWTGHPLQRGKTVHLFRRCTGRLFSTSFYDRSGGH